MCFSAEASFTGAAALAVLGCATLKITSKKQNMLWASIPLLFALQQFCEGIVWLDLRGDLTHSAFTVWAKDLFLLFALAFWPVWIPLSLLAAEVNNKQKNILLACLILGIYVAYINLTYLPPQELNPSILGHSIRYTTEAPFYKKTLYLAAVSIPCFASSIKKMWIFGLLVVVACLFADYFYTHTFTSVWCFFGAILSATLYIVARVNVPQPTIQNQASIERHDQDHHV